jgi:hypothetical protein
MVTRFNQTLSIPTQIGEMRRRYPQFTSTWQRGHVTWTGTLTPAQGCQSYTLRIGYRIGTQPKVFVTRPQLASRIDERIPHRYGDGSLCLYRPKYGEWTPTDPIALTIVPWSSLWLYDYEVWLVTGQWAGGGEHPEAKQERDAQRHAARPRH